MIIDYKNIKVKELQAICKALNDEDLLEEPIEVKPVGQKKQVLATAFVEAIHAINDDGKLNAVPDDIYDYYLAIAVPEEGDVVEEVEEQEVVEEVEEAPPPPKRGRGRKAAQAKAAPAKQAAPARGRGRKAVPQPEEPVEEAKPQRPEGRARRAAATQKAAPAKAPKPQADSKKMTRAQLFVEIVSDGEPRTKKELVNEMIERYEGSTKEAPFWVNVYVGVAIAFGRMEKLANGTFVLLE